MKRNLNVHLRWLTALAVVPACADDDGAIASASDTDSSTSSDEATITLTTADSSDSAADSTSTGPAAECGNDVVEDGEVCDGPDLGDATCESEGFGPGMLLCAPGCGSFDTTECAAATECGNGIIEAGEDCDGDELGDETCVSQDFDGGDLACGDDCSFDVTACVNLFCGDGEIGGKEQCDGDALPGDAECGDLGVGTVGCTNNCVLDYSNCCGDGTIGSQEDCDGENIGDTTCADLPEFDGGTLSCAAGCAFDTSACTQCGDGVAQGAEACDGDDFLGADCTTVDGGFFGGTLTCDGACGIDTSGCNFCGNGEIDVGETCDGDDLGGATCLSLGYTGGSLGCTACGLDESGCTNFPLPGATELVITEIMQNPAATGDNLAEYFEVHNPSLLESFQLQGCVVEGGGVGESFTIDADLVIDAGAYLTFAVTDDPGFTPDFVWPAGFILDNASDTVRLVCDGTMVDEVTYDGGATFPDPDGASMQLEPTMTDAVSNDNGANWCESSVPFGFGDLGTPGAPNTSCLPPVFDVDFCRLQFPTAVSELEGTEVDVFGRLFIAGVTDQSGTNDPEDNVLMQVGYGPDGSDPDGNADWVWQSGAPNGDYGPASPGYEANNDEYAATMTVPDAGEYDFAVRFTGDGGLSFAYCDGGDAGSSDGYAPVDAGQMTSLPYGDPAGLFFSEYYEGTAFNKIVEIYNPAADPVNLAGCAVITFFNGNAVANPAGGIPLTGIVGAGEVHVLCSNPFAQYPFCDQLSASLEFNGDDAVELRCSGATNDVIGQIGFLPVMPSAWTGGSPTISTLNFVLRRSCDVTEGDPDGTDAFDPSLEWTGLPINGLNPQPEHTGDLGVHCPG